MTTIVIQFSDRRVLDVERFYRLRRYVDSRSGIGTWQSQPDDCYNAVRWALDEGYRHIDTAYAYGNESDVGRAIRDSGISREQIFVTTKLPSHIKDERGVEAHLIESLRNLRMDYVDMYLIHAPWPWAEIGKDCTEGNIIAWKTMLDLQLRGFIRCCGVSNFHPDEILSLIEATGYQPAVNQIRYFVGNTQPETTTFCQENGILVEAYSPLATGAILENGGLSQLAARYDVSVAQRLVASRRLQLGDGQCRSRRHLYAEFLFGSAGA